MAAGALVVAFRRATKKNGANGANGVSATANASRTIADVFLLVEQLQEVGASRLKELEDLKRSCATDLTAAKAHLEQLERKHQTQIARLESRLIDQQKTIVRLQEQLRGSPERP